jgi:hypothetical protein
MTDWKLAMLLALPLMVAWRAGLPRLEMTRRLRVWGAMFGASLVAAMVPALPLTSPPPMGTMAAYMLADFAGAWIALRPKPIGCAQRAIGLLFAAMVLFHVGFILSAQGSSATLYTSALGLFGWVQWACLVLWGGYGAGKVLAGRFGFHRAGPAGHGIVR